MRLIHRYWEGQPPVGLCPASEWGGGVIEWVWGILPTDLAATISDSMAPRGDGPRHRSNLARYWLLAEHGGMWADHDVWPLVPPSEWDLPDTPWVASVDGQPCLCLCGGDGPETWRAILAAALDAPTTDTAMSTSGRERIAESVASGAVTAVPGLIARRGVTSPVARHTWVTSRLRR